MRNDALLTELRDARPGLDASLKKNAYRAELARNLQIMRKRAGLTQTQLAQKLGWKQPQISTIENATGPVPDPWRVMAYAEACGVKSENTWVFSFDDHEPLKVAM